MLGLVFMSMMSPVACLLPHSSGSLDVDTGPAVMVSDVRVISGDLVCMLPSEEVVRAIDGERLSAGPAPCRAPELVRVTRVIDGDTFSAWPMSGLGGAESVRIIGVNTPETYGTPQCWGPEAAEFAEQALELRLIWLTFDQDCEDDFGRTLAYVHLSDDFDCFFERLLLRGGLAETMTFAETSTFSDTFSDDARWADDAELGLWQACD
jgi:micrococcal nuclease